MPDPLIGVVRGLDSATYHAIPGASPSKLMKFHGTTPAHAKVALDTPIKPSPEMILGTLAHAAVLEPDKPLPRIVMVPKEYPETEKKGKKGKKGKKTTVTVEQVAPLQIETETWTTSGNIDE